MYICGYGSIYVRVQKRVQCGISSYCVFIESRCWPPLNLLLHTTCGPSQFKGHNTYVTITLLQHVQYGCKSCRFSTRIFTSNRKGHHIYCCCRGVSSKMLLLFFFFIYFFKLFLSFTSLCIYMYNAN